ncbi:hypothetical protein ACJJTC_005146 [Scirpophaga incertulas]
MSKETRRGKQQHTNAAETAQTEMFKQNSIEAPSTTIRLKRRAGSAFLTYGVPRYRDGAVSILQRYGAFSQVLVYKGYSAVIASPFFGYFGSLSITGKNAQTGQTPRSYNARQLREPRDCLELRSLPPALARCACVALFVALRNRALCRRDTVCAIILCLCCGDTVEK